MLHNSIKRADGAPEIKLKMDVIDKNRINLQLTARKSGLPERPITERNIGKGWNRISRVTFTLIYARIKARARAGRQAESRDNELSYYQSRMQHL